MSGRTVESIRDALQGVLDLLIELALPLSILAGLLAAAAIVVFGLKGQVPALDRTRLRFGFALACVSVLVVAGWAGLRSIEPVAAQNIEWRESAEASANPVPDAPPVYQFSPVAASLVEKTFTRTLTLPPGFLQRIGAEGVQALSPYLSDPSAQEVMKITDKFKKIGSDVEFSRNVTRLEETPIPFDESNVKATFKRLEGKAYDVLFEGRYTFKNPGSEPMNARFVFPLPQYGGTVRDIAISVGGQAVPEPAETGAYEWNGTLAAGASQQAVVKYQVLGARTWHYDIGSRRRRVQKFHLEAAIDGPMQFMRGSILPTTRSDTTLSWDLSNIVTAQQIALSFPPDVAGREAYLQALRMLPACLALLAVGMVLLAWRFGTPIEPGRLALGIAYFGLGLGLTWALSNYLGPMVGVIAGPLAGAFFAFPALGSRSLSISLPIALLPSAFLSPQHSSLFVVVLAVAVLSAFRFTAK